MPVVNAPSWGGVGTTTNLLAGEASQDARMGLALKMAAWQNELEQRLRINSILRNMAAQRAAKKAAEKKKGLFGLGGTAAGAGIGALLAAPTGGLSMLAGASLGGGLGGTIGSGIDTAMGGPDNPMGGRLLDFSTEFLDIEPSEFFSAAPSAGGQMYPSRPPF